MVNVNFAKGALLGGGIFLAGVAMGYFIGKKNAEVIIEGDLEEFEPFEDEEKDNDKDVIDFSDPDVADQAKKFISAVDTFKKTLNEYSSYSKDNSEVGYEEYVEARERPQEGDVRMIPYIITPDEFTDENLGYEKLAYTYYRFNNILADEEEDIVSVEDTIGETALKYSIDAMPKGVATVYIRNDNISCDYEVTMVDSKYYPAQIGGTD